MDIWIVSTLFGYYEQCYYECLCADFCVDVCFRFSHNLEHNRCSIKIYWLLNTKEVR